MARREPLPGWAIWLVGGIVAVVGIASWRETGRRRGAQAPPAPDRHSPLVRHLNLETWLHADGTLDPAGVLRDLGLASPGEEEATLSAAQHRALDDWTEQVYVGRETAPPTERMLAALAAQGVRAPERVAYRDASAFLSARDYALTLADRTAEHETDAEIRILMTLLHSHSALHDKLIAWSWQTVNSDVRRIPKDALRAWAEGVLQAIPTPD